MELEIEKRGEERARVRPREEGLQFSNLLIGEEKPISKRSADWTMDCGISRDVSEIPYVDRPCDRAESPRIISSISHILAD